MTKLIRKTGFLLAAATVGATLVMSGCGGNKGNHEKWKADATAKYNKMRSAVMLEMAQQQFDTGDLDQCEKTVKEAVAVDPTNAKLFTLAGRVAMERGQLERSYHLLGKAIELDEKSATPRYYQGVVLQRWQKADEARARYQEAYDLEPDNVSYLLAVSEMLVELDRADEAVATLEGKVRYFDQNASIRVGLGHLYLMKKDAAKAVAYFEEASVLDPESLKVREELALARLAAGQVEPAIGALEELVKEPKLADRRDLRRALAQAEAKVGRVDKARQVYLDLARSPYGEATDWVRVGELALKAGDQFGALEAANQAVRLDPQSHEGYLLAGMVWQKRSNLDQSLKMFDRAAELAASDAAPLILRGLALEKAGRKSAAAEAYQEALKRQPNDPRAQKLLSNVQ